MNISKEYYAGYPRDNVVHDSTLIATDKDNNIAHQEVDLHSKILCAFTTLTDSSTEFDKLIKLSLALTSTSKPGRPVVVLYVPR